MICIVFNVVSRHAQCCNSFMSAEQFYFFPCQTLSKCVCDAWIKTKHHHIDTIFFARQGEKEHACPPRKIKFSLTARAARSSYSS